MLGGLLSSAALGLAGLAQAAAPGVDELRVERGDEGLFLYAQLSFELAPSVQDALLETGWVKPGDLIVIVAGNPARFGGQTNSVRIYELHG